MISNITKSSMVNDSKKFLKSDMAKEMAGGFASEVTKNVVGVLVGD